MQNWTWARSSQAILVLLVLGALSSAGFSQQTDAADGNKVVLRVGDQAVTLDDFNSVVATFGAELKELVASEGRRPVGEQYVVMLLLSQQAASRGADDSPEYRRRLAMQRIQWLAEAEMDHMYNRVQNTSEEINAYYSANKDQFEEVQTYQVVVRKSQVGGSQASLGLPPREARTRATLIRAALASRRDIKSIAEEFQRPNEVIVVTDPSPVRRGQLPPQIEMVVFQLEDGGLSEPIDTGQAVVLIKRISSRLLEVKEVAEEIDDILRRQKVQAALVDMRRNASVWMDEEFFSATPPAVPGEPGQAPAARPSPQPDK